MGWKDSNFPAFPVENTNDIPEEWRGMTMRQYYKAMAMQGLLSSGKGGANERIVTEQASELADAMLREDEEHANSQD